MAKNPFRPTHHLTVFVHLTGQDNHKELHSRLCQMKQQNPGQSSSPCFTDFRMLLEIEQKVSVAR